MKISLSRTQAESLEAQAAGDLGQYILLNEMIKRMNALKHMEHETFEAMSILDYFSGRVEARFNDINTVMGQKRAVKLFTDIRDRMLKELPDTLAQATVDDMREMLTEFVNLNGMRHGLDLTDPEESEEPAEQTQPAEQAQS